MPTDIVITGVGMATSLGFDAATSCAAARAGVTRPETLDYWVEDAGALESVPVVGRTMGWYTEGFAEVGRLVQLGRAAARDVVRSAGLDPEALARTPWLVNLADGAVEVEALRVDAEALPASARESVRPPYAALKPWIDARLMPGVLSVLPEAARRAPARVLYHGPAGAAVALAEARRMLTEGRVRAVIVGGIDALVDLRWLDAYQTLGLLKSDVVPAGTTPGEAAAFLCVETAREATARGAAVLGVLGEPAAGRDTVSRFAEAPPLGAVLASVMQAALGPALGPVRRPTCHTGLGGDARRAGEWGRALVRLQPEIDFAEVDYVAAAFGETGAASGFVSAGVALHAFARGTAASDTALVWDASDDGLRGAFLLTHSG